MNRRLLYHFDNIFKAQPTCVGLGLRPRLGRGACNIVPSLSLLLYLQMNMEDEDKHKKIQFPLT